MLPANSLLNATAPAGPHLPTATLRQYAAGTLAPAARHRVEAHTLACPRCADVLEGLLQTPAATTDQALAQLQQRLRWRVQQTESARPVAVRTRPAHRWVVLQLAAAATLLFGLVAGGWWTWQQRHPAPAAVATQPGQPFPAPASAPAADTRLVAAAPAARVAAAPSLRPAAAPASIATQRRTSVRRSWLRGTPLPVPGGRVAASPTARDEAATKALNQPPTATVAAASEPSDLAVVSPDSAAASRRVAGGDTEAAKAPAPTTLVRDRAMPAVAPIPPAPMGGYAAWREKIRHEATEFKPEEPERPVSGSVQLRLLIGADGKIQEIRVLHGLRADYDAEAQRLVCDGPGWVPGIGGGKRAAQVVDVAVPFQ